MIVQHATPLGEKFDKKSARKLFTPSARHTHMNCTSRESVSVPFVASDDKVFVINIIDPPLRGSMRVA